MSYLESCVSWTIHLKEILASTIPWLKPPWLLFMGASQRYSVVKSSTHTLQELQANIQRAVYRISTGTLQNVFANMIRRVHHCEERNGGHFQHLLQENGIIINNKIYIAFLHGLRDVLNTLYHSVQSLLSSCQLCMNLKIICTKP
jgi:hypothetical protein